MAVLSRKYYNRNEQIMQREQEDQGEKIDKQRAATAAERRKKTCKPEQKLGKAEGTKQKNYMDQVRISDRREKQILTLGSQSSEVVNNKEDASIGAIPMNIGQEVLDEDDIFNAKECKEHAEEAESRRQGDKVNKQEEERKNKKSSPRNRKGKLWWRPARSWALDLSRKKK